MSRRVKTARCVLLLVALCLAASPASGVELVSIPSQDGKLQLPGYWFEAAVAGPRPTVILLHGCGGALDRKGRLSRNRARVAEFLNVEGMHALVVDSFTPRGETSICQTPPSRRRIQPEDRRDDVFAAIQWLARRPIVDASRIAVVGYSNGGGAVLSVLDRTARAVRSQPLQPRLAIAFYPPCARYATMWRYEIGAPLLLMIGELDDWTPAHHCVRLHDRVKREQPDASFELVLYPESHHGFDSYGPPRLRFGLSTASGRATVGGNAEARDRALRRMFEFLSARLGTPLRLTHDERFRGHRYAVPPASGFARIDDVAAVPVDEKGRERYRRYLGRSAPKAFTITETGGSHFSVDDADAVGTVAAPCVRAGMKCWLYAVDDRVVWSPDPVARVDPATLPRKPPK